MQEIGAAHCWERHVETNRFMGQEFTDVYLRCLCCATWAEVLREDAGTLVISSDAFVLLGGVSRIQVDAESCDAADAIWSSWQPSETGQ